MTSTLKNKMESLLLYLGSGLFLGSLLLSIPVGIIFSVKKDYDGFRYGAFFLGFSTTFVPTFAAALICFYYEFLGTPLAHALSIPCGFAALGVLVSYKFLEFRSVPLFLIVSVGYIFTFYLSPIFIWNMLYCFAIVKLHKRKEIEKSVFTTP